MTILKAGDIENFAKLAGFSGKDADTATAIALAESGGDTKSHRAAGKDDSYGLWQINMLGALGPDRRKKYNIKSNDDLYNPSENARVAYAIYKDAGHKFDAWTTYTSGAYKDHMSGTEGLDAVPGSGGDDLQGKSLGDAIGMSGIASAINSVGSNLFKSLSNVIGVILAVVLLIVGVAFIAMESKGGKKLIKGVAGKVIP